MLATLVIALALPTTTASTVVEHPFMGCRGEPSVGHFFVGRLARQSSPARSDILKAARIVMSQARYATLVTLDQAGQPQARVVDPFEPEADFAIWIATNPATRKVAELLANPRVTLLYFDAARRSYVTVIGRATIVRDPAEKARRWKDEWAAFYKDRNRGDDYVLIRVVPTRLEIVADSLGMKPDPATWRPVIVEFK